MSAVWEKIKADLVSRWVFSGLIMLTIAAASALLTLALGTLTNLYAPYDRAFAELNGAHVWLYFDRDLTRAHDLDTVVQLPGVMASTGRQFSRVTRARMRGTRAVVSLRVLPLAQPIVNRLQVQDGRYLAGDGEVLAGKDLNYLYGLVAGDRLSITNAEGKGVELPVVGMVFDPMWDTYRTAQPPYLYLTENTLRELFPDDATWDWSVGLQLADSEAVEQTVAQARAALRPDAAPSYTDWRDVRRAAMFGVQLNFIFLGAFSAFAMLSTVLVIATNLSTTVFSQFRQIGILKAVGFSGGQILGLYLGQYAVLGLLGGGAGLVLGQVLAPWPLKSVAASMSTTYQPPVNPALLGTALGTIMAVALLAVAGAALRGARLNPIRAIVVGAEAPRHTASWPVRLAEALGCPIVVVLGLNDVFARPFRSLLTGLGLLLGVVAIVFSLNLNQTLAAYRQDPSQLGIVYDALVTAPETSDNRVQRLLQRAPGVVAFYRETIVEVQTLTGQAFRVRAVEGDLAAFSFQVPAGRLFAPGTREAVAGRGLLVWLGLRVGDELILQPGDRAERRGTWRIVGQYLEAGDVGQMLMVDRASMDSWLSRTGPDIYYLRLDPRADLVALRQFLHPKANSDVELTVVRQKVPAFVDYLQVAVLALAVIVMAIALVNVFNMAWLAVQEKRRVVGILKTVGMTPGQVMLMVSISAAFLGLLAVAGGIPLGLWFARVALNWVSALYGYGQINSQLSEAVLVGLVPLIMAVSVLGSLGPAVWAARQSAVEAFRRE